MVVSVLSGSGLLHFDSVLFGFGFVLMYVIFVLSGLTFTFLHFSWRLLSVVVEMLLVLEPDLERYHMYSGSSAFPYLIRFYFFCCLSR